MTLTPILRRARRIGLPVACALLVAGPVCFTAVADSDAGWHVAIGRLVLQGQVPHTNALSWAYGSFPWYATSWLYDAILAAFMRALPGALGAQIFTFALLAVALAALAEACDREGTAWIVPAIALLLLPRIVPRPQVASWAVLACVLALAPRGTRGRAWSVLVVAIGGNLHAGAAFAAGVLGLAALEAFWRTRRGVELALAAAAGLALLANPGVLFDARYLLEHLLKVNDVVQLQEFEPPFFSTSPAFYVLLPVALLVAVLRRRERPAQLVAAVIFAALGLRAVRMTSEAELVWAPLLAWGLARVPRRAFAFAVAGLALAAGLSVRFDPRRLRPSPAWDEHKLPVRAARYLEAHDIAGPGFNAFRDGGYLEMARPGVPAFIDGRVQAVPEAALLELQEVEKTPAAFQSWLARLGCEWAITTRVRERMGGWHLLHESLDWELVYWDDASEVYVRRGVPRFAQLERYRAFLPWGHAVEGKRASELPLLAAEVERFLVTSPRDPLALIVRCAALHGLASAAAASACNLRVPPELAPLLERARSFHPAQK
jgi:hypothetical protein